MKCYYNKAKPNIEYGMVSGRKLMSIDGVVMDYDYNGLRIKKGDKTFYWFNGNLILERWGNNSENYIYYYYDESGVCGMNYNGIEYYFRKNILGDILAIYDSAGNLQCRYRLLIALIDTLPDDLRDLSK